MSDSHGQVYQVKRAVKLLEEAGAEAIVHCGDIGNLEVLETLAGWRCWYVWGNTDHPDNSWSNYLEEMGLPFPNGPAQFTLNGKSIGVFHGHERGFAQAIAAAEHDYLLHGHTHSRDDRMIGGMRIINPGALHRAIPKTVALLDPKSGELDFLEVR
jgi:hypothetical protein